MEIERKWLVEAPPAELLETPGQRIDQGYLALEPDGGEARIRHKGTQYFLTVKSAGGLVRDEHEIELTQQQFTALWPATEGRRVEKVRHVITVDGGLKIELDVYAGDLAGLLVAEVEFATEADASAYEPPAWFALEVTGDGRYQNRSLAAQGLPS
jgi:adenylate cyclase